MITVSTDDNAIMHLQGTVEHFEAVACKDLLRKCISENLDENMIIDLSGLESVSSITLSFLLFGLRSAKLLDSQINYQNMPPALFNMARVSGIESILIR